MSEGDEVMVMNPALPSYQMTGTILRTGTVLALVFVEYSAFNKQKSWIAMRDLEVI